MGIMAGIILVLLTVIVMRNGEREAFAAPSAPQGVDNTGAGLMIGVGGSQTQTNDILWVINKHEGGGAAAGATGVATKGQRITLSCYQVSNGARFIKLVAVRDISFDQEIVELNNDRPRVKDIMDQLKRSQGSGGKRKK